jgi:hypothetical protein
VTDVGKRPKSSLPRLNSDGKLDLGEIERETMVFCFAGDAQAEWESVSVMGFFPQHTSGAMNAGSPEVEKPEDLETHPTKFPQNLYPYMELQIKSRLKFFLALHVAITPVFVQIQHRSLLTITKPLAIERLDSATYVKHFSTPKN